MCFTVYNFKNILQEPPTSQLNVLRGGDGKCGGEVKDGSTERGGQQTHEEGH